MAELAGTAIVLFTDLVGSTELRVRLGEEAADELRGEHDRILGGVVEEHGGTVVKGTGDGIMAVFGSASGAVAAATAVQQAIAGYNDSAAAVLPLHIRVGLSAGDVSRDRDDYFGTPVIEAARLCAAAAPDQVLAADLVRVLTRSRGGHRFGPAVPVRLKGLPAPVDACEVLWHPDGEPALLTEGASPPGLRVRVLGPFEIDGVDAAKLASRKGRQLLRLLALGRGLPVSVDRIVDALWADAVPAKPNDQVSVLVSRLRSALGADTIVRTDAGYALQIAWLDLIELETLASDAEQRLLAGSPASSRAAADAALRLARGPLLADEPDAPWAEEDRFAVQRLVGRVTAVAAEAELDGGEPATAASLAERALELDRYDEVALRLLMRAHDRAGRPASALAAYAKVRERLRDDLGASPSAETEAIHAALLAEPEPVPPPVAAPDDIPTLEHAPLAGRAAALGALDQALEDALTGGVRFVVIEGESGIGKSTVLDVWAAAALDAGVLVLRGVCDEVSRQLPLQAVLDGLDAALAALEPEVADDLLAPDADVLAPLLGRGRPAPDATAAVAIAALGGSGSAQAVLFAALVGLVDRLASAAGAVLVIDDLHFAGESTVEWLRFLQRRSHGHLLVVVATRPEGKPVLHADEVIALGPLDLRAAVELVGDEARAAKLLERSGGHPLLLVELAHAHDTGLPASIREAAGDRLRQMGDAAVTMQIAAVLGNEIDLDLLADVSRRSPIDVLDDIERGVAHRFLDESGASLVFRHALVRDAIEAQMSTARRSLLHREAASALSRRHGADPLEVARHARLGGEYELAAVSLGAAAARATSRHDRAEAMELLNEAIGLHDLPALRLQRGLELVAAGDYLACIDDATAARDGGAGARAFELLGWALYYTRRFDEARVAADQGALLADDAALEASCLVLAGRVLQAEGDLRAADARMTRAEALVDAVRVPVVPVWIGSLRTQQSRHVEAVALEELALAQPRTIDHPFAVVHAGFALAHSLAQLGRPDAALHALDQAELEIERRNVDRFVGRTENWRGWIIRYLGAFEEADERNIRAYETAIEGDLPEPMAHALLDRADGALLAGDVDRAAELLAHAAPYDRMHHVMRWRHEMRGQLLTARLELATHDWDAAAEHAAVAASDGGERGVARYEVLGSLAGVLARAGRGDPVDPDAVDGWLARLPEVAGSEAWWWMAWLARALGSPALRLRAESAAAALAEKAGDHRAQLEHFAAVTFAE
ncbi:MAG: AAA family ATPase [Actinobacteria bacterium]|nr:AAA family ATPase [Actinomycetota bacterium]